MMVMILKLGGVYIYLPVRRIDESWVEVGGGIYIQRVQLGF